jgi:hypothetical protein
MITETPKSRFTHFSSFASSYAVLGYELFRQDASLLLMMLHLEILSVKFQEIDTEQQSQIALRQARYPT